MSLAQLPFTELLRAFQSREPTPGGGTASALAGAVGASLLAMVAGLPKPRVQDPDEAQRLTASGTRSAAIGDHLSVLMDRDSDAYNLVVAAFRLPSEPWVFTIDKSGKVAARMEGAFSAAELERAIKQAL